MKRSQQKFRFAIPAFVALVSALILAIAIPSQLPAQQDIDDVIGDLDADFSLGSKQEIKQSNKEQANEQNREDIKILEDERRRAQQEEQEENSSSPSTPPAAVTADVTINFTASVNDADVDISLGPISLAFSGTITTGLPLNLMIPNVPLGTNILSITCQSSTPGPNCNLALSGLVNASCVPLTIPPIPASPSTGSSTCTVTAPAPPAMI
ncbi:MAG: hypothetical protein KC553_13135 [Nitrospina sp.]|nr:hypothetical protein [Nitrospina sp.]